MLFFYCCFISSLLFFRSEIILQPSRDGKYVGSAMNFHCAAIFIGKWMCPNLHCLRAPFFIAFASGFFFHRFLPRFFSSVSSLFSSVLPYFSISFVLFLSSFWTCFSIGFALFFFIVFALFFNWLCLIFSSFLPCFFHWFCILFSIGFALFFN